jgi:hypothetical protein
MKIMMMTLAVPKHCITESHTGSSKAKFRCIYIPECDVSVDECDDVEGIFVMERTHSFKICYTWYKIIWIYEAKSGYVQNFIMYIMLDTVSDKSLKISHMAQK